MTVPTAEVPTGSLLEVWGDPIAHSLSPRIHAAAYAALGWDWTYGRRRVAAADFSRELGGLGAAFRGLSLTFPLNRGLRRRDAPRSHGRAHRRRQHARPRGGQWRGFNTDVGGIVGDVRAHGLEAIETGRIVAGATATSALVALAQLGARTVEVVARRPDAATPSPSWGASVGRRLDRGAGHGGAAPSAHRLHPARRRRAAGRHRRRSRPAGAALRRRVRPLADPAGRRVAGDGAPAVNGLGMLVRQAVQIRAFRTGDVDQPLPDEDAVVDIMARALVGD
jgi:shikimate dehydrogenase